MATLNQEIESILTSGQTVSSITRSLKALGIAQREIDILLANRNAIDDITFGVEIECYNVTREEIAQRLCEAGVLTYVEGYNHHDYRDHFKVVTDASLTGENTAEVVSPILKGQSGMQTLKKVCGVLNEINAKVNKSCGLHVHFGLKDISFKAYKNIFINYARLESLIDSFMPESRRNNGFCKSVRRNENFGLIEYKDSKEGIAELFDDCRYYKVNPVAYIRHNTIEFRQHSGTTDFTKMQKWIEFLKSLIAFSKKAVLANDVHSFDEVTFMNASQKSYYRMRQAVLS